jgi:hypothetical protein
VKAPASIRINGPTISPAEVNIGEGVTITVTVTNTGDLIGAHEVVLQINGAKDGADAYTVNIDGVSGSFVVRKEVPAVAEDK